MKDLDWDRTLMGAFGILLYGGTLWQIAAVVLKLCGVLGWSWWWVMAPAMVVGGLFAGFCFIVGVAIIFFPPRLF